MITPEQQFLCGCNFKLFYAFEMAMAIAVFLRKCCRSHLNFLYFYDFELMASTTSTQKNVIASAIRVAKVVTVHNDLLTQ